MRSVKSPQQGVVTGAPAGSKAKSRPSGRTTQRPRKARYGVFRDPHDGYSYIWLKVGAGERIVSRSAKRSDARRICRLLNAAQKDQ